MKTISIFLIISPYPRNRVHGVVVGRVCRGALPTLTLLCALVGFGKWRGQQETAGQDQSEVEVEEFTARPPLGFGSPGSVFPGQPFSRHWGPFPPLTPPGPGLPTAPSLTSPSTMPGSPYVCSHFGKEPFHESLLSHLI